MENNRREYHKKYMRLYRERNAEKTKKEQKEYMKIYREQNKETIAEQKKKYRETNKGDIAEYMSKYKEVNKNEIKIQRKEYKKKNKTQIREYRLNYDKTNKEAINKKRREYYANRIKTDTLFKIKNKIRLSIIKAFKQNKLSKTSKTLNIIGCSFEELKHYIESRFESWMTWDNHGLYNGEFDYGWDMDHIIPLSSAITEEDVIRLNHYTNLQPLCSKINRDIKRNELPK
jgi:hypothetical protein